MEIKIFSRKFSIDLMFGLFAHNEVIATKKLILPFMSYYSRLISVEFETTSSRLKKIDITRSKHQKFDHEQEDIDCFCLIRNLFEDFPPIHSNICY